MCSLLSPSGPEIAQKWGVDAVTNRPNATQRGEKIVPSIWTTFQSGNDLELRRESGGRRMLDDVDKRRENDESGQTLARSQVSQE